MDRSTTFVAFTIATIIVYLGLAVHVVTHNRRRAIAWIFGAFCLTIINYYVTSLFLLPGIAPVSTATPLALRLKWAGLCLSPAFHFHLATFYFPSAWYRYRNRLLLPAYLLTSGWP